MAKVTKELFAQVCAEISDGKTLAECCRAMSFNRADFHKYMEKVGDEARNSYARARENQAEAWADSLIEIADETSRDTIEREDGSTAPNSEWMQRSKLRYEARKWLMSKNHVGRYGERTQLQLDAKVTHGADAGLLAAIRGGKGLPAAASDSKTLTNGEPVDID